MLIDDRLISKPLYDSQCLQCRHLIDGPAGAKCKAYPDGIAVEFILNEIIHDKVMPDQEGEYVFEDNKELKKSVGIFGKIKKIFKNLFTGQSDDEGNVLKPSKKNPKVRRWQKDNQIEMEGLGAPSMKGSEDYLKPKGKDEKETPLFSQQADDKKQLKLKIAKNKAEKKVYHYSDNPDLKEFENKPKGIWLTTNEVGYARRPRSKNRIEAMINTDELKLATEKEFHFSSRGETEDKIAALKKQEYDGAKFFVDGDTHFLIFDKKNIKTNKSADSFAKKVHEGQKYNDDSNYYDSHLEPVKNRAHKIGLSEGLNKDELDVLDKSAYLHDVLEDTETTTDKINSWFGPEIETIVRLLSNKIKSEGLVKDIDTYYKEISDNKIAKIVKAADRIENIIALNRIKNEEKKKKLLDKYSNQLKYYKENNIYPELIEEALKFI